MLYSGSLALFWEQAEETVKRALATWPATHLVQRQHVLALQQAEAGLWHHKVRVLQYACNILLPGQFFSQLHHQASSISTCFILQTEPARQEYLCQEAAMKTPV